MDVKDLCVVRPGRWFLWARFWPSDFRLDNSGLQPLLYYPCLKFEIQRQCAIYVSFENLVRAMSMHDLFIVYAKHVMYTSCSQVIH